MLFIEGEENSLAWKGKRRVLRGSCFAFPFVRLGWEECPVQVFLSDGMLTLLLTLLNGGQFFYCSFKVVRCQMGIDFRHFYRTMPQ